MSNWLKLEGDVCAVTGALGGMGVEICREFARNGANVVLLDLDEEKVKAAAADLAAEWGPYGVRSNCVEPCFVKTPMSANFYADPEVEKSRSRLIATRRIGEVSDIANAVMFLASKRSDFTTGDAIKVDGGFSNMMGDLTAKPGGRRAYADNYLKNKGVELWSDESGVAKPTDQ